MKPADREGNGQAAANRRLRLLRFLLPNYAAAYRIAGSIASYIDESDPGDVPKQRVFESFMQSLRRIDEDTPLAISELAHQHPERPRELLLNRKIATNKRNNRKLYQK